MALIRFPNESEYIEVKDFKMKDFKPDKEFEKTVFGWWGGIYIELIK